MATTYPMPKWGVTMEEGTIVEWVAAEGTAVSEGDVLAVVTTDKVDLEFESPVNGIVAAHLAGPDDTVPCGDPVVVIAADEADLAAYRAESA